MQVAEVTGHTAQWIDERMPLARCYQYQIEFYVRNGYWCVRPGASGTIDTVL